MHKISQVLLSHERGVSQRTIVKEVKITRKTIALYLGKFLQTGVNFSELLKRSDQQLEEILGLIKPLVPEDAAPRKVHFNSLVEYSNKELSRTGVNCLLLWEECISEYPSSNPIEIALIYISVNLGTVKKFYLAYPAF